MPKLIVSVITALLSVIALIGSGSASAQSDLGDRCYNYANEMVALGHRARAARCPAQATQHMDWNGHMEWCQRQSSGRTRQVAEEWVAKLDGCSTSRTAPPAAVLTDAQCYLRNNPDICRASQEYCQDPNRHYREHGQREGRVWGCR